MAPWCFGKQKHTQICRKKSSLLSIRWVENEQKVNKGVEGKKDTDILRCLLFSHKLPSFLSFPTQFLPIETINTVTNTIQIQCSKDFKNVYHH